MVSNRFHIQAVSDGCIECGICVNECSFLKENGTPKEIADRWEGNRAEHSRLPFQCSLCGLCFAVCPKKVDPCGMFLAMRRIAVQGHRGEFKEHNVIVHYERRGSSERFSHYHLPDNCTTVFFPGCALSGTRADTVKKIFLLLRGSDSRLGIVLDCCSKPTHDLGRQEYFRGSFGQVCDILGRHRVEKVIVGCPSCYQIFKQYGEHLQVETVYEVLNREEHCDLLPKLPKNTVAVHDPCSTRFAGQVHQDARDLLRKMGCDLIEMKHRREKTFCCGEGGSVPFLRADYARQWGRKRGAEAECRIMTYCAGCAHFLRKDGEADHLLDLIVSPVQTMASRAPVARSSMTYYRRWRLKAWVRNFFSGGINGSRRQLG